MAKNNIVFKKEFEKKLKRLGIKDRFIANIKDQCVEKQSEWPDQSYDKPIIPINKNKTLQDCIKILNTCENWRDFINRAFSWHESFESRNNHILRYQDNFWLNIQNS